MKGIKSLLLFFFISATPLLAQVDEWKQQADAWYRGNEQDTAALQLYTKVMEKEQEAAVPRYGLLADAGEKSALILSRTGNYEKAIAAFQNARTWYTAAGKKDKALRQLPQIAYCYVQIRQEDISFTPPAITEYQTREVFFTIETIEAVAGNEVTAVVRAGSYDGLYRESPGIAYSVFRAPRDFEETGKASVLELSGNKARVQILVQEGKTIEENDAIKFFVRVPRREKEGILWLLACNNIFFLSNSAEQLYDYRQLLYDTTNALENDVLKLLARQVNETHDLIKDLADKNPSWTAPFAAGRYKGRNLLEMLQETREKDVKAYIQFVQNFPGKYIGIAYKINETYATWLMNDAPASSYEFREQLEVCRTPEDYHQLYQDYRKEIRKDEFLTYMQMDAEKAAKENDFALAFDLLKRVREVTVMADSNTLTGWALFSYARVFDLQQQPDSAEKYYRRSIEAFARDKFDQGMGFAYANIGTLYYAKGRYKESLAIHRQGFLHKQRYLAVENDSRMLESIAISHYCMGLAHEFLGNYDSTFYHYGEGITYYKKAATITGRQETAQLYRRIGKVLIRQGNYARALTMFEKQLETFAELGDELARADVYDDIADAAYNLANYREAYENYALAARIKLAAGKWDDAGFSYSNMGQMMWTMGKLDSAILLHQLAIDYREKGGGKKGVAYSYKKVGELYKETGSPKLSLDFYNRSLHLYAALQDTVDMAALYNEYGKLYSTLKDDAKAIENHQLALQIYQERGMQNELAETYYQLGTIYSGQKNYRFSEEFLLKSLELRKKMGDLPGQMYCLTELARIESYGKLNTRAALVYIEQALALAKITRSGNYIPYCYAMYGYFSYAQGKTVLAQQYYDSAYAQYVLDGDYSGQCHVLLQKGVNFISRGAFDSTLRYYNTALELARKQQLDVSMAAAYSNLGEYYYLVSDYAHAFAALDSSERLYTANGNDWGKAGALLVRGNTCNLLGDMAGTFAWYQRSDSIYRLLGDELSRATILNNTGTVYFYQGNYAQAKISFFAAKDILDKADFKGELAGTVQLNLGEVYYEEGIYPEAEMWLERSRLFADSIHDIRTYYSAGNILGKLKMAQKKTQEAEELLLKSYQQYTRIGEKSSIAECATQLGKLYLQKQEPALAVKYLQEATGIYKLSGQQKHLWEPLYLLSQVERSQQHIAAATAYLKQAVEVIEEMKGKLAGGKNSLKQFSKTGDKVKIYELLISDLVAQNDVEGAFYYQEKASLESLKDQTRGNERGVGIEGAGVQQLELKIDGIYQQLVEEKLKPDGQRSQEKIKKLEQLMTVAEEDYQFFVDSMVQTNTGLQADISSGIDPRKLDEERSKMPDDMAVLELLVTDDHTIIFVAGKEQLHARVIDVKKANVEAFVNNYYQAIVTRQDIGVVNEAGAALYNLFIAPVESLLKDKKRLALIPTGILYKVPFHALCYAKDNKTRYLIQDFEVFYVNNMDKVNQVSPDYDFRILAFGNSDNSLPNAEAEVKVLKAMFDSSLVYVKLEATEDIAKELMPQYPVVHFATHGNLDPVVFYNSYLTLAPNTDKGEDGKFTIREISKLRLHNCQLITLSACNTAVNEEKTEGWINNPAKTFISKGARSVVASLWMVDDKATSGLMEHFYHQLKLHQTKSGALRAAQIKLIETPEFTHPYYWSAFELLGEWK